jgi:hypothetical protein
MDVHARDCPGAAGFAAGNQLPAAEVSLTWTAPTAVCDERHRMPSQRVDYPARWQAAQLECILE